MIQAISNNNGNITIAPLLNHYNDYNNIIADGNNFANFQVLLQYSNKQNINITGNLNLEGDNGDLQTRNINFSPTNGVSSEIIYSFKVTSTSPGAVTYKVFANTSIGNLSVSSVKINFLPDTVQNQKIVVSSGAINNRLRTQTQISEATPGATIVPVSSQCPSCPTPTCPTPTCPTPTCPTPTCPKQTCPTPTCPTPTCPTPTCPTPTCPACPACPTVNTKSSLSGSTDVQKCEIDYTPIIIIGVLIIILLLMLLYLQLTNNK